jgi:CRP/FNR family cyclic AMP-dependent transcriptional regulator
MTESAEPILDRVCIPGGIAMRALLESTRTPFTSCIYPAQAVIFMQGDCADSVVFIENGAVRLEMSSASGREAICGVLTTGAFLGEGVLRGDNERRQTAVAMTSTTVLEVAASSLQHLLRRDESLFDQFIGHVLMRHTHLEADLTDQIIHTSEQRLARTLLHLAGCCTERDRRALPQITQEDIAKMVGTTRARVSAFMSKFKRLGLLEADGGVLHVNPSLRSIVLDPASR